MIYVQILFDCIPCYLYVERRKARNMLPIQQSRLASYILFFGYGQLQLKTPGTHLKETYQSFSYYVPLEASSVSRELTEKFLTMAPSVRLHLNDSDFVPSQDSDVRRHKVDTRLERTGVWWVADSNY
jgi:hypothetical protein